jgi:spermidine synthase
VFRTELKNLTGRLLRACAVMLLLVVRLCHVRPHAGLGRAWPVRRRDRVSTTTPYQRLVITRWKDDTAPVHQWQPAVFLARRVPLPRSAGASGAAAAGRRVLVLGGGDGLALREILRYPNIEHVTLVDLDPAMTAALPRARNWPAESRLVLGQARRVVNADAAVWLRTMTTCSTPPSSTSRSVQLRAGQAVFRAVLRW